MKVRLERPRARGRAGVTLLEVLVTAALLGLSLGTITLLADSSKRAYSQGTLSAHLESRMAITMNNLSEELQGAGADSALVGASSSDLRYEKAVGFEDGQVEWVPGFHLLYVYEDGELANGIDDNGNELVDEGRIVLVANEGQPDERRRTITRWVSGLLDGETANGIDDNGNGSVDEPGVWIQRIGRTLVITLTLERRDGEGRSVRRTGRTSVRLRN